MSDFANTEDQGGPTAKRIDFRGWDHLKRPIWVFDPSSCRGVYANPSALELWDAPTLTELLDRDFSQLSQAVRTRIDRLAQETAAGKVVTEQWTFYPGGTPTTVNAAISSIDFVEGRLALLFEAVPAIVLDEELRAVEALRHTSTMISMFDKKGDVLFKNPAAFEAYGESGWGFADRFPDLAQGAVALAKVLDGEAITLMQRVRTNEGERFHTLDALRVLDPASGKPIALLSERDVTAQVEAERALAAVSERAEVAEAKERFLANMSHELRTPLNSILGFSSLLRFSTLNEVQAEYAERISVEGGALLSSINNIITLSELTGGATVIQTASFDPGMAVWEALKSFEPAASQKGLSLELEIAEDLPTFVIGDQARFVDILHHYISNALKFTKIGRVLVQLDAIPTGDTADLILSVSDTGAGVDTTKQQQLFSRFTQLDDGISKTHAGQGLGLAICKESAALMGGEVGVESAVGQGSRFWVRLTLKIDTERAGSEFDGDRSETLTGPICLNVIYADDHQNNRLLVKTILEGQGHCCDVVCDGLEAVEAVRSGAYDLILMDIQMPVQDGLSASIEIRAMHTAQALTPIVALTANTLTNQLEDYARAGIDDVIAKPLVVAELHKKVEHWGFQGQNRSKSAILKTMGDAA